MRLAPAEVADTAPDMAEPIGSVLSLDPWKPEPAENPAPLTADFGLDLDKNETLEPVEKIEEAPIETPGNGGSEEMRCR